MQHVQHSNWIIRRMGGKGSVSTMSTMGMMSIVQYGLWVGGIFTLGPTPLTRGHTCHLILWMGNASASMTRTSGMESNWLQQLSSTPQLAVRQSASSTHSLRIGGECALALAGYSDTQIQKMGRWRGATFKEYISENLSNYSEGMSRYMKKIHGFVNIDAEAYKDVSSLCMDMEYGMQVSG